MTDSYFQLPPDSSGKRISSLKETISGTDYYTQYIAQRKQMTFYASSSTAAIQSTNAQMAVNNLTGSGLIMEITRVSVNNLSASGHAGIIVQIQFSKGTGSVSGSGTQVRSMDSTDSIPSTALISLIQSPTGAATLLGAINFAYHSASIENAAARVSDLLNMGYIIKSGPQNKGLIINPNEFFALNFLTADAGSSVRIQCEGLIYNQ